ncbi:peptidase domain-containing ABC transporter [Lichenihabitans sp. Uapishka_5]|uniref:peptidase domain-containing ABC transporter n=1 Tax=Lichenihabitans sp. Uapishka_5 TaxID=3037302 RepID=UPI0029E7F2FE|nr:peptidase domain-containing ABC transporter [Lichenihabitans sp. Uapishka_5]MDX7952119.1 peptidase domain-containing ABC transporter [Lichenihabitans sp. Uapishka_5]
MNAPVSITLSPHHTALRCLFIMALQRGVHLQADHIAAIGEADLLPSALRVLASVGLTGKVLKGQRWRQVKDLRSACPMMALRRDGAWVILVNVMDGPEGPSAFVLDPRHEGAGPVLIPRAEFVADWSGLLLISKRAPQPVKVEERRFGLGWFLPEILRQRRHLRDVALAALMSTLIGFAIPLLFQVLIDKAVTHRSYQTLGSVVALFSVLVIFDSIFAYTRQYLMLFVTSKIDARLASRTFAHLLSLPLHFFESRTSGLILRNLQQTETIRQFLTGRLFQTALDAVSLPITLVLLTLYSGRLTLVVLAFSVAMAAIIGVIVPIFRRLLERLYQAEGARQSQLVETIHGIRTIKSLAIEPSRLTLWNDTVAAGVERRAAVGRIATLANVSTTALEKSLGMAILGIGAIEVFNGSLTLGTLIAFNMVSGRVTGPLVQIVGLINEYQQTAMAVDMLGTVMQHPRERDPGHQGATPPITGHLSFDNVSFRYPGAGTPALDGVSFTVEPGQVIGVVGRSGSGKTTVTRLVQAVQTAGEGTVRIDGVDIRAIDLRHLRQNIGVVLQENFLFRGTIRQNVAMTRPDASLEEVIEAARMAGAHEFIERLPAAYDTMVEENGANFSGGQRQRLAIARALVLRPRLLIFDEATSALDPESEAIVQEHLTEIAKGRTLLIVSHRLTSLAGADAILVLDQGKVLDFAPHTTLLTRCHVYQRLWLKQTKFF